MRRPGQASEHDADHGEANECGGGTGVAFEVAGEATIVADPGQSSFDDPSFGQDDKAMQFVALDDLELPGSGHGDGVGGLGSLIAGVGEDALDERKEAARAVVENEPRAIAILHIGRVDDNVQQEAERIDENVPFPARDFFARIEALRIERGAPF